jgi:flagellar biosynthetic protein FliQ
MSQIQLQEIFRDAVMTGLKTGGPILLASILVGISISIIQAATSINEQTMTFVPKLIIIGMLLLVLGNYMIGQLTDFVYRTFEFIATVV